MPALDPIALAERCATSADADRRRLELDRRTVGLVIDQHRRGVLPEAVLLALLAAVGLPADQVDR